MDGTRAGKRQYRVVVKWRKNVRKKRYG